MKTSIKTQKAMLTQYAKEHGFLVVEVYVDDGWSGLNFQRPDFNRMLDDIEAGKIDVVITKDLSRLGRDHLKVGHFTEIYFPMKNVRYIAVNDCVDTANKNNNIAALKNVMNEFYSRDNSRKIRSSIRARAKAGLYRTSFNPIGYRKAPDNHNKLIVDTETAWIVKRIFELANAGMGAHKIAKTFREEHDAMINRVTDNWRKGVRTHIFLDEFHVVFENEYSASFFNSAWRRFRKRNAYPTALTQNVEYLLDSVQASTMLSNSELVVMLNQAAQDRQKLAALLNISDEQISYITNADAGCGLIKYGSGLVPFVNRFPKDTKLYRLMTTKPTDQISVR